MPYLLLYFTPIPWSVLFTSLFCVSLCVYKTPMTNIMDSPTTNILEILKMLAEEEDMKVTAFGTKKGISVLVVCVLVGATLVQPLAWGLAIGLIIGAILATFVCWEQKSVAEVIANMPREKQMRLVQKILTTGIGLSKLTPSFFMQSALVPDSTETRKSKSAGERYDGQTVTLPNGKVASREEILLALRDCLAKEMGMSVSK